VCGLFYLKCLLKLNNFRAISIKTQVRRLRYFQILMRILESKGLPKEVLARKVITWSEEHHSHFELYNSSSGEIVSSKKGRLSQSFENYFIAAKNLGLLIEQHGLVIPTRIGEVLGKLSEMDSGLTKLPNAYGLTVLEKFYFPYLLLSKDFDILITLFEMLSQGYSELPKFYEDYKTHYSKRLDRKMEFISQQDKSKLFDALQRVQGWKNPKRYSEDIIPSRLNWLIDLGLVDENKFPNEERYVLNGSGIRFFENLPTFPPEMQKEVSPQWLNSNYFGFIGECLKVECENFQRWNLLNIEGKQSLISEAIDVFLIRFNTFGIPRLSVEQTCLFISLFSLTKRKVIVEFEEILEWIGFEKEIGTLKLGFRGASRPGESYLIVSNA